MINRSLSKIVMTLAIGVFASVAQAKPTLKEVTAATEAAAAKAPDQAAAIVEEKVKATPEYACPIIKAAIKGAKLQKQDETGLIAAALKAAPEQAPEIRACLADQVAGGKHPVTGKGPVTKDNGTPAVGEPGGPTDESGTWNDYHGVVGTYLSVPASGTGAGIGGNNGSTAAPSSSGGTKTVIIKQPVFVPGTGS